MQLTKLLYTLFFITLILISFLYIKKYFLVCVINILISFYFLFILYYPAGNVSVLKKNNFQNDYPLIPKIIFQTYHDKKKIPEKVYKNIKKYARGYTHLIYDDRDCLQFLNKYYKQNVVDTFNSLNGAHKADLFRYCVLYIYGGVYLDIKTELVEPIDKIFNDRNLTYTSLSIVDGTVYQGVIASRPKNDFFIELIQYIVSKPTFLPKIFYHSYTSDFFDRIKTYNNGKVETGVNGSFYLLDEKCTTDCWNKDRYGRCCSIFDGNKKVMNTRYEDFPWK